MNREVRVVDYGADHSGYRCKSCRRRTVKLYSVRGWRDYEQWDVQVCQRERCGAVYSVEVPF